MPPPSQPLALAKRADLDGARPVDAPKTNGPGQRSAPTTREVLAQFDVLNNPRYAPNQPHPGVTWCNIFVWDATRALSCEIPHWLEVEKTPPGILSPWRGAGSEPAWRESNANAVARWLSIMSARRETGRIEVVLESELQKYMTAGCPVVAAWENPLPSSPGHVAMVISPEHGGIVPAIVQAGGRNFFDATLSCGFGSIRPRFYAHP